MSEKINEMAVLASILKPSKLPAWAVAVLTTVGLGGAFGVYKVTQSSSLPMPVVQFQAPTPSYINGVVPPQQMPTLTPVVMKQSLAFRIHSTYKTQSGTVLILNDRDYKDPAVQTIVIDLSKCPQFAGVDPKSLVGHSVTAQGKPQLKVEAPTDIQIQ